MEEQNPKPTEEEKIVEQPSKQQPDDISPLEEARKLNEENKKLLEQMTAERKRMEKLQADILIGGRSFAGKERVTPEQEAQTKAQTQADEIVKAFK